MFELQLAKRFKTCDKGVLSHSGGFYFFMRWKTPTIPRLGGNGIIPWKHPIEPLIEGSQLQEVHFPYSIWQVIIHYCITVMDCQSSKDKNTWTSATFKKEMHHCHCSPVLARHCSHFLSHANDVQGVEWETSTVALASLYKHLLYMGVAYYCLNQSQAYISSLQPLSMGR